MAKSTSIENVKILLSFTALITFIALFLLKLSLKDTAYSLKISKITQFTPDKNEIRYSLPSRSFNFSLLQYLKNLKLFDQYQFSDTEILQSYPTFVTGASSNHLREIQYLLASFSQTFNSTPLIFYDLGIESEELNKIQKKYNFLEVRKFNFTKYPPRVANLSEYRWKPLLIAEILSEKPSILWMDASVYWQNSSAKFSKYLKDLRICLQSLNCTSRAPLQMFDFTGQTISTATNPRTFKFFSIDERYAQVTFMYGANLLLIMPLNKIRQNIIWWWTICALEPDCMAPKESYQKCKATKWHSDYADCHRFDQSVLNILMAKEFGFNESHYTSLKDHQLDSDESMEFDSPMESEAMEFDPSESNEREPEPMEVNTSHVPEEFRLKIHHVIIGGFFSVEEIPDQEVIGQHSQNITSMARQLSHILWSWKS